MAPRKPWHHGLSDRLFYSVGVFMAAPGYGMVVLYCLVNWTAAPLLEGVGIVTAISGGVCAVFAVSQWLDYRREHADDPRDP